MTSKIPAKEPQTKYDEQYRQPTRRQQSFSPWIRNTSGTFTATPKADHLTKTMAMTSFLKDIMSKSVC